jgi:hypothetical protein
LISIVKICLLLSFTFAYNYMGSGLPTEIRAGAIGFASAIGKLGSISMPFIVMFFYNMG